jgi:hypothetical protein
MNITKEKIHDGKILKELIEDFSKNNNIMKVLEDGTYDSRDNFKYLVKLKITPVMSCCMIM